MAVIENLDIVLGARTEKYDRGLDLATGRLGKFQADVNLFGQTIDATMVPLRDFAGSIWRRYQAVTRRRQHSPACRARDWPPGVTRRCICRGGICGRCCAYRHCWRQRGNGPHRRVVGRGEQTRNHLRRPRLAAARARPGLRARCRGCERGIQRMTLTLVELRTNLQR